MRAPNVRILVVEAEGSVPREPGAVMWVRIDGLDGTIGGGALEQEAIAVARKMLADDVPTWSRELRAYPLGPALGQCCGGMVRLLFERADRRDEPRYDGPALTVRPILSGVPPVSTGDRKILADWPLPVLRTVRQMLAGERPRATVLVRGSHGAPDWVIEADAEAAHTLYLYGAGHVGRAVVRALTDLPFAIVWVDVAADRFPRQIPPSAAPIISSNPAAVATSAATNALHLIMTFSHALDLAICHSVLAREFAWAGLIGSATKRARFEKRLVETGISLATLERLCCPIGIRDISGKEPAMIAISVAAQLAAWSSHRQSSVAGHLPSHLARPSLEQ
jgi:xanthine dehydrogenase accessory factor